MINLASNWLLYQVKHYYSHIYSFIVAYEPTKVAKEHATLAVCFGAIKIQIDFPYVEIISLWLKL